MERQKRLAAALASHLAAIVTSASDAIISKDLDGFVMSWNTAAERMLGYDALEMVGQSITCLIPADLIHEEAAILARIRANERIEHYRTVRLTRDGHRIQVSLMISPVLDETGRVIAASKIIRNVINVDEAAAFPKAKRTVLLVEDEVLIRMWMAEALREVGYRVFEAASVAEAKEVLSTRVDLVFSDVNLLNAEDGFALEAWLREHHPAINVILTSGGLQSAAKIARLTFPLVKKPYDHASVLRIIERVLH